MIPAQEITLLTDGGKPRASGDDPSMHAAVGGLPA